MNKRLRQPFKQHSVFVKPPGLVSTTWINQNTKCFSVPHPSSSHHDEYIPNINEIARVSREEAEQDLNNNQRKEIVRLHINEDQNPIKIPIGELNSQRFFIKFMYLPPQAFTILKNIQGSHCDHKNQIWHFQKKRYPILDNALNKLNPPMGLKNYVPEPNQIILNPSNPSKESSLTIQQSNPTKVQVPTKVPQKLEIIPSSSSIVLTNVSPTPKGQSTLHVIPRKTSTIPSTSKLAPSALIRPHPDRSTLNPETLLNLGPKYIFFHPVVSKECMDNKMLCIKLNSIPIEADVHLKQIFGSQHDRKQGIYCFTISTIAQVNEVLNCLNPKLILTTSQSSMKQENIHCESINSLLMNIPPVLEPKSNPNLIIHNSIQIIENDTYFQEPSSSPHQQLNIPKLNNKINNSWTQPIMNLPCSIPGYEIIYELFPQTKLNKFHNNNLFFYIYLTKELSFFIPESFKNELYSSKNELMVILSVTSVVQNEFQKSINEERDNNRDIEFKISGKINDIEIKEIFSYFGVNNIDITDLLNVEDRIQNSGEINVYFTCGSSSYEPKDMNMIVSINIMRKFSIEEILIELKRNSHIPAFKTKIMIHDENDKLGIPNTFITNGKTRVSLKCLLSNRQIRIPCRGIYCNHYNCFDAQYFFELFQYSVNLICPICFTSLAYQDIKIDRFFQSILNSIENIAGKWVEIDVDWNFNFSSVELDLENTFIDIQQNNFTKSTVILDSPQNISFPSEVSQIQTPLKIPGFEVIHRLNPQISLCRDMKFSTEYKISISPYVSDLLSKTNCLMAKLLVSIRSNYTTTIGQINLLNIQLKMNDIPVIIPTQQHKPEFTVDITKYLIPGNNLVSLTGNVGSLSNHRFIICSIAVVRRNSAQEMLNELKKIPCIPLCVSRDLVIHSLKEGRKDGIYTKDSRITVSLKCPLGKTVMEIPCKGIRCKHFICFDAFNFLKLYEKSKNWRCPICDDVLEYEDLKIDGFLQSALNSLSKKFNEKFDVDNEGKCFISPAPAATTKTILSNVLITTVEDVEDKNFIVPILSKLNDNYQIKSELVIL